MTKGLYSYLREAWKKPDINELRKKLVEWRSQSAITRIEKPTRLDKARALGYKAKP
jgi:large subunit ribosomal protein L15e